MEKIHWIINHNNISQCLKEKEENKKSNLSQLAPIHPFAILIIHVHYQNP